MVPESNIEWLDWTDEAFQRAKREDKPILLDISAVWCHWCHRLDHDTYSKPEIAEYVESHFIPIRVDTDKRPDINRRYNMGGWPTTAFLTPEGLVIGGGTYFPPDQMRQLLHDVHSVWKKSRDQSGRIIFPEPEGTLVGDLSTSIIDEVLGEAANNFDSIYGGFGSQPKFPNTDAQELALLRYYYSSNHEILKIATLTLSNVGKSGLFDHEMGGFFRYSTTRDWSIPHYEKMSEDNARWLTLYLHAYQITGQPSYAEIARSTIEYILAWLCDREKGCFYGSQDADEDYYKHTKDERFRMKAPYVDKNIYTSWNALMISSFFEASTVLRNPSIKDFALKSLDRLLSLNNRAEAGMYHFYDGKPHLLNQLTDQMETVRTLCYAYELADEDDHLRKAEEVMRTAVEKLYDKEHGGFYDTSIDSDAPGFLSKPVKPLHENSIAALALIKLHYLTENRAYHEMAEETLKHFVNIFPQFGYMAADYALAVDLFLNEPTIIRIIGSLEETRTLEFLTEAHRIYEPRKIIKILNPSRDKDDITKMGYTKPDNPTAFVCVGRHCTTPITEPAHIASELTKLFQTR